MWKYALGLALLCLSLPILLLNQPAPPVVLAEPAPAFEVSRLRHLDFLTGLASPNTTGQLYGVYGTDLGISWDDGKGNLRMVFGDTYGAGFSGCGAGPSGADWRSNVLALINAANPANGLLFTKMIEDRPGHAKELLPSLKIEGTETTVIPTAGVNIAGRDYLYYMSVRSWVSPGFWTTNYAGLAYSDDNGQSWQVAPGAVWLNPQTGVASHFQQVAVAKVEDYLYLLGTPNGRLGPAYLARVPQNELLDRASYQYWDGQDWQTGLENTARPIFGGPVGELSVQYNSYFKRWLVTYLDEARHQIMLRSANALTGPWTAPQPLVDDHAYPQLYGGFMLPASGEGHDLYFTLSQWCAGPQPYNVSLMQVSLDWRH